MIVPLKQPCQQRDRPLLNMLEEPVFIAQRGYFPDYTEVNFYRKSVHF